jgi:PKD repeat protein
MPVANAGPDQYTQSLTAIALSGAGSNDPDGSITGYSWAYGDGMTGTGSFTTHAYMAPGMYTAVLTVTDNKGAVDTDSAMVTVANRVPIANAGPDKSAVEDTSVAFSGSGSSDPDGTITAYSWTFGDGQNATGVAPSHVYVAPGTYMVNLTVTDDKGASSSDSATVTIAAAGGPGWAYDIGGSGVDLGFAVTSDASANRIVAGTFQNSITIGTIQLNSAGGADAFIAKFSSTGGVLWAKRFGGTSDDAITSIGTDDAGNVYAVGRFQGTANFGATGSFVSAGGTDIVLAKYNANGVHQWSKQFGDINNQSAESVSVTGTGDVVFTGYYVGSVNFGGTTLQTPFVGDYDVFVAKFDTAGVHKWSKNFVNTGNDFGLGVSVNDAGDVALVGYFNATINLGGGTLTAANALTDAFALKLSSTGAYVWAKKLGADDGGDVGKAIAIDGAGNVVVAGESDKAVNLGGGALQPFGMPDVWVAKYDTSGTHVWSRRIGGQSTDAVTGVAIDGGGNVLVEGNFRWTANFGGESMTAAGYEDVYVAKYTGAGAPLWAEQLGGLSSDYGNSLALTPAGDPLIAGTFYGTGSFGGIPLASLGMADGFIARLLP